MALADRDKVDDGIHALDRPAQAGRVRHVAFGRLRRQVAGAGGVADEGAYVVPPMVDRARHVRPDEAGAAGDEDLQTDSRSKFCQYRLGVGPIWPWYFEPSSPLPYGFSAGSLSCTNEIWPIFIPW